jgi:gas vesicle protein
MRLRYFLIGMLVGGAVTATGFILGRCSSDTTTQ